MTITRALRKAICRALIGAILFAQLAIAAYACPVQQNTMTVDFAAPASAATAGMLELVDDDAANLCVEHCRYGQQSAEQSPAPALSVAILNLLYEMPVSPGAAARARPPLPPKPSLAAVFPPHAILHCCLRT